MTFKLEGQSGTKKIEYSPEFVEKIKKEFPELPQMVMELLTTGSEAFGRFLRDTIDMTLKPEDIIKNIESGNTEIIAEAARKSLRIRELYKEWLSISRGGVKKGFQLEE